MIRIAIIDRDNFFRASFKSLLESHSEIKILTDVSMMKEIPNDFKFESIDLLIYDPSDSLEEEFEEIQHNFNYSRLLILSDNTNKEHVMKFIREGITGYYSKKDCPIQFQKALKELASNVIYEEVRLGSVVRQSIIDDRQNNRRNKIQFSPRELDVLKLVCLEKTNAQIAQALGLSERTIESHRRRMIDRADCRTILGVVLNALELDLNKIKIPVSTKDF